LIMVGSLFQVISINPLTYKLLKRRYRNYEKYE
ncbi:regulator, partial [Listeria monocytogenes]